jgi:hypothetical protein
MNNEQQQIIDEAYDNYCNHFFGYDDIPVKEVFVFECKTDSEFSEKWGLKIEELDKVKNTAYSLEGKWFEIDSDNKLCYCGKPIDTTNPDCVM